MDPNQCILCDEPLSEGDTRQFKERAIATLIASSERRRDNKHIELQKHSSIVVHTRCVTQYNREACIKAAAKEVSERISKRRRLVKEEREFDFKSMCLFCGMQALDSKKKFSVVQSEETKINILKKLEDESLNDEFKERLSERLKRTDSLIEAQARYHVQCMKDFYRVRKSTVIGRPPDEEICNIATEIINYILEHDSESQFSVKDILKIESFQGIPNIQVIKTRISNYFKDDVVFFSKKDDFIICFRDAKNKVITDAWYNNRCKTEEEERNRIVDLAANIIVQDIRSTYCNMDSYKLPTSDTTSLLNDMPTTLRHFLDVVIKHNKKINNKEAENKLNRRVAAFGHGLMTCVRPRSFLSPLLLGLSVMMHKKHASKALIESLSYLGFCASYSETLLFEASVVDQPQTYQLNQDSYVQFVYDNADHNTNTLDGSNTFHAMGGIMCVTPDSSVISEKHIPRLKKLPSAEQIGKFGFIRLKNFEKKSSRGLQNIIINDLDVQNSVSDVQISLTDVVLFYGKHTQPSDTPGWNGLMEAYYKSHPYRKSTIITLPFINAQPSNYNTIFTVLIEAATKCVQNKQQHCFVTFDQPLYVKAREILANVDTNDDPYNLKCVIVRLGGFHALMSFLGSIGFIMDGSGLKEVFSQIYAEASTDKALQGHAFSRAVRGHSLIQIALASIIFSSIELNDVERELLTDMLTKINDDDYEQYIQQEDFVKVKNKFQSHLNELKKNGPTAKLWVQYFEMVTLVKQFIEAERSANWNLHLNTLQQMLPYFHATGHFLYAKCAQLYLQDMYNLQNSMNAFEYNLFVNEGFFTIRRSDKFWCGIWSDMTIEQVLMKSMKSQGGLTHGRGISDSVLSKWILSMIVLVDVCTQMEDLCNVSYVTSEQHVDTRISRISRDTKDIEKLKEFFEIHDPFPVTDKIMSISSGIVGDSNINCFEAREVGVVSLKKIVGSNFGQVKFERKKKVLSLKTVNSSLKINNEIEPINPLLLFQRISLSIESKNDMKSYLQYELAPLPLSLFDENGFRKTQKSVFYDNFECIEDVPSSGSQFNVIDGGFFLHKIVWHQNDSIEDILNQYVTYAVNHYSTNACIVFDGYPDCSTVCSTKACERSRRKLTNLGREINFNKTTKIAFSQEKFLANEKNKEKLISMLSSALTEAGLKSKIAEEDADLLIIQTAIEAADQYDQVFIHGQDIDLLVILTQLAPNSNNIYLTKSSKGRLPSKSFNSQSFKYEQLKQYIAFLHIFTGCDTTSCFYKQGKNKLLKIVNNKPQLQQLIPVFYEVNADPIAIAENGKELISALYSTKSEKGSLHELRFLHFQKSSVRSAFKLESLPPTEGAATEHCFRTYQQLQQWLGNKKNATDWGWKQSAVGLQPVYSKQLLIPPELIKKITCRCETGCKTATCGCRKYGLHCTNLCASCHGESCSNIESVDLIDSNNDDEVPGVSDLPNMEETMETEQMQDVMEDENSDSLMEIDE